MTPLPAPNIPTASKAPQRQSYRSVGRRLLITGGLALLTFFVVIQFIPYGRDHVNPPVVAEPVWDSEQTRALFVRACADCHSNQTTWPWYSQVAPASWMVARDVYEGRAAFNVSEWGRVENTGSDAAETVQNGTMPPWFYTLPHPPAQLTPAERDAFLNGLLATFGGEGGGENGGGQGGEQED